MASIRDNSVDFPEEIWDQIISKLDHECHLEPLSLVSKHLLSITNRHKQTLKISKPTTHLLPSLFHRFPNLKHLSFSLVYEDPAEILDQIADLDYRLETLDLSNHNNLRIEALEKLPVSVLSDLKSFKLCLRFEEVDRDLEMIAKLSPDLEELDLGPPRFGCYWRRATGDGVAMFSSKLKGLRRINLMGNDWVDDDVVISLSKNCPNLEEIGLDQCRDRGLTQFGVGFALQACKNLKKIGLQGDGYHDTEMNDVYWARSLTEIHFSKMSVSDSILCSMAEANLPLKSFTLSRCRSFTVLGITEFLKTYNCLDYLDLKGIDILNDNLICALSICLGKLRNVKLNRCEKLSDTTLFLLIKQCRLLETVEMKKTNLGSQGGHVVLNPQIKTIGLSKNGKLGDESLKKIATACPNLEMVRLSSCLGISSKGVGEILRNCRNVKHLQITSCSGVKNLGLDTSPTQLKWLGASGSGLNEKGLIDIAEKCPDLMFLGLSGCQGLTPKGVLEVVEKCTKLKEIDLKEGRNMSTDMLPWMIVSRPSLRKIVPPDRCADVVASLLWRHGCYLYSQYH